MSRCSVCIFTQGLILVVVPRRQPLTGASGVYLLLFCLAVLLSSSGSWSKPEWMAVINMQLGNLSILKMLFSAHWSQILKMVTVTQKDLGSAQMLSRACFCFSNLFSPVTLAISFVSVWKYVHSCDLCGKQSCSRTSELVGMLYKSVTHLL